MNSKSNMLPACSCWFAGAFLLAFFLLSPCYAVNVTIGWDPNEEPDLEGYNVYHNIGSPGPPYKYRSNLPESKLADPLNPMATLTGLKEDTMYYIALTAYDGEGNESAFSDDVCVQVVESAIEECSSSATSSSGDSGGGGGGGSSCFISTASLKNTGPIFLLPFFSQLSKTFFAILFLFVILAVKSVLPVVINFIKTNKEK